MKKLLIRLSLLFAPFIFLALNYISYERSEGDLAQLGRISVEAEYRDIFKKEFLTEKKYIRLSEADPSDITAGSVLILGDSFSQHKNLSYHNYAANLDTVTFVNFDGNMNDNPIQAAFSIANGDFFDKNNFRYVLVQSVERDAVLRARNIDRDKVMNIDDIKKYFSRKNQPGNEKTPDRGLSIFQDMLKYFVYSSLYNFDDNAFISQVYKTASVKDLFSTRDRDIIFYYEDLEASGPNSEPDAVKRLNKELNLLSDRLKDKNIKLIFLLCPDKLSLYYPFISEKNIYPETKFFDLFDREERNYIYIDAFRILRDRIEGGDKDIYFADDSHWSPFAAKIIGKELVKALKKVKISDIR